MTVYSVAQQHPAASDNNPGTPEHPFRTINRAAREAGPGDTVRVHAGIYRERVNPRNGGEADRPVIYEAADGDEVCVRGSDEFRPDWQPFEGNVLSGGLSGVAFGTDAYAGEVDAALYGDFNPFLLNFNRRIVARPHADAVQRYRDEVEKWQGMLDSPPEDSSGTQRANFEKRLAEAEHRLQAMTRKTNREHLATLGQCFLDGKLMTEVMTLEELNDLPRTWMVNPDGNALLLHPTPSSKPLAERLVEISTRHTVFAPLERGLRHIHVRGFIFEHAANHWPTWGEEGWPQVGIVSTRSGHHWVIENNTIRYARGVGLDCGSEGSSKNMEHRGDLGNVNKAMHEAIASGTPIPDSSDIPGRHEIRGNIISDNGHCGIAGIGHYGTRIIGNVLERNNRTGLTSPWWEFAAIKFHFFFDGLIEGNLIRDNDAHGVWLDNKWTGSRVTRNVIVNNLWSGINMELGRGPALIDNNVIAYTRHGSGVYGHDASDITIAHNLIYANASCGVWFAYCTKRVKNEDGCWDIKTLNNMILNNGRAAVGYSLPWECAGDNISDGNLLAGSGEYLDEGSGSQNPLFVITNKSHCAQFPEHCGGTPPMTAENTRALMESVLREKNVPESRWPDMDWWNEHYYVSLDLWRKLLDCDTRSAVAERVHRDGLQSRNISFEYPFDKTLSQPRCEPVDGVDKDFLGQPMPATDLLPGPFQHLNAERCHITLWPVRGAAYERTASTG